MKVNDMLLQMAYAAGQIAQTTLPQTGNADQRTSDGKDFHTLLSEKRTEAEQKDPDTVQKDDAAGRQPAAQGDAAMQQAAAAVQQAAVQIPAMPVSTQPQDATGIVTAAEAAVLPAAPASVPAGAPQAAETAAPRMTAVAREPLAEAAPAAVQPDRTDAAQPAGRADTPAAPDMSRTEQVRQTEPGQEQETGAQTAADSERQTARETGVEVLQAQSSDAGRPVFRETEVMPQRVGDAPVLDTQSGDMDAKLTRELTSALDAGTQRLELKLTPEHLGNVVVEMSRTPEGVLHVVLHAENGQAAKLLSQHSDTLGLMLQNSQQGEVRLEVRQPDQSERPWQQPDQNGGQGGQEGQQQERRRQPSDPERFLQQLRLGLVPAEF